MKDELGAKNMKEFVGLRAKTYNYLTGNSDEYKKQHKDVYYIKTFKFEDCKNCLEAAQIENKTISTRC